MASIPLFRRGGPRPFLGFAAIAAAILAGSTAVVWPLWSLASSDRHLYTVLVLGLGAGGLCVFALRLLARRAARSARAKGRGRGR